MINKTTMALALVVAGIIGIIGIGFATSSPRPAATPHAATKPAAPLPSAKELQTMLAVEQPAIDAALSTALPALATLYTVERGALYDRGEWYGAILQYRGTDADNRDTLRLVMQKKNGTWTLRTNPPRILVSRFDVPDAPTAMLDALNAPAPLPGTETSPAITPSE